MSANLLRFVDKICACASALFACALFVGLALPARADALEPKRVALVIGNGAYDNAPKLDNAAFDARAVADAFRKLGFEVVDGYDLDINKMRAKISAFSAALADAKSAVIYYAGHGISMDDENYLIPTDITLKNPTDLDLGAISVSLLLRQMKREDRVNIVILDACRDNPFAATLAKGKTRALVADRGLSRIDGDLARGTLIAFASDPKSTALDGPPGRHSPFTEAFHDHVFDAGVPIDTVMSRVRAEVWEKTHQNQLPWVNTSLIGDYALNPASQHLEPQAASRADPASPPGSGLSSDALLWESAQHSNLAADYQAYLDAFPTGMFAQMARNRIATLQGPAPVDSSTSRTRDKVASAEPVPPPDDAWRKEIGTSETERALDLAPPVQKEIQQRLASLELYKGPPTGKLDDLTRQAIADWQKTRGVAPTSWLGPLQLAELRVESETAYEKAVAQPVVAAPASAAKPAFRQAVKPATRSAMASEVAKPAKRVAKQRPASQAATAYAAPPPPAPTDNYSGTPAWRRKAGLPVNELDRWDRAAPSAGFLAGVAAGAVGGALLQHLH